MDANITANNDTQGYQYRFYKTAQLSFLAVIFAFILLGNTGVLVNIMTSQNRKSRMNFFLMQLAIADLTTGLFTVLPDIVWRGTVAWHAGTVACKLVRYLQSVGIFSSVYVLVALSVDRVDAIARPMNFSTSGRRSRLMVVGAWTLALTLSSPIIFLSRVRPRHGVTQCSLALTEQWMWRVYLTILALLLFIIPALIIAVCYITIVLIIWSKRPTGARIVTKVEKMNKASLLRHQHGSSYQTQHVTITSRVSSQGVIPQARIKSIKMTLTIVIMFILCWCPFFVYDLLSVYGKIKDQSPGFIAMSIFIQSLAPLNSAANPVVYFIFSPWMCCAPCPRQGKKGSSSDTGGNSSCNNRPANQHGHNTLNTAANTSVTKAGQQVGPGGQSKSLSQINDQVDCSSQQYSCEDGYSGQYLKTPYLRSVLSPNEHAILLRHISHPVTTTPSVTLTSNQDSVTTSNSVTMCYSFADNHSDDAIATHPVTTCHLVTTIEPVTHNHCEITDPTKPEPFDNVAESHATSNHAEKTSTSEIEKLTDNSVKVNTTIRKNP